MVDRLPVSDSITTDAILDGRLRLRQESAGYRFSIDAVLLGYLGCQLAPDGGRVLDLGCGVGVVALVTAAMRPDLEVVGVEVQRPLADLAAQNATDNDLGERVSIVNGDVRTLSPLDRFDLVLCNPPYYPAARGRLNPSESKAAARHEVHGTLTELLTCAGQLLTKRGRVRFIYPADALMRALGAVDGGGLKPVGITPIHSFAEQPARLVFVDGVIRGRREMKLHPPVVIFSSPGEYTAPIARALVGWRSDKMGL